MASSLTRKIAIGVGVVLGAIVVLLVALVLLVNSGAPHSSVSTWAASWHRIEW